MTVLIWWLCVSYGCVSGTHVFDDDAACQAMREALEVGRTKTWHSSNSSGDEICRPQGSASELSPKDFFIQPNSGGVGR